MERLKALFITHAYPPSKYPRSVQISHLVQFLRKNINITIMASRPDARNDPSLIQFTPLDNVTYPDKTGLTKLFEKIGGYRIKKKIFPDIFFPESYELYLSSHALLEQEKYQSIATFGQPMSVHIAALKLKKKFPHIRWIAHFSDPWVDNPYNTGNAWVHYLNKKYQSQVFKYADKLLFTSQETISLVMKNYKKDIRKKVLCLPHSFNAKLYPLEHSKEKNFTIRYLGNFYGARQPDCLIKAVKIIHSDNPEEIKNIKIEFIGSFSINKMYEIPNEIQDIIDLKESVNYLESLKLMKDSDLLLIIDASMEMSPFFPSKLVDYIGANRPIFGITPPGTSKRIIEELGFLTAHPNDPQEIAKNLLEMIKRARNNECRIKPEIRNQFSIETVGMMMEKFFI